MFIEILNIREDMRIRPGTISTILKDPILNQHSIVRGYEEDALAYGMEELLDNF